jgi:hypothetical protein
MATTEGESVMPVYSSAELINYVKALLPNYTKSSLELLTITAKEDAKGKAVTLEFRYGVDGYEWE